MVFPCGVYANALCRLSTDLRNGGFKVYAAIWVMFTIVAWLGCALETTYHGVWQAKLFFAPGLTGRAEKEALGRSKEGKVGGSGQSNGGRSEGQNNHQRFKEQEHTSADQTTSSTIWRNDTYTSQRHSQGHLDCAV